MPRYSESIKLGSLNCLVLRQKALKPYEPAKKPMADFGKMADVASAFRGMCEHLGVELPRIYDLIEYGRELFGRNIPEQTLEKHRVAISLIGNLADALGQRPLAGNGYLAFELVKEVSGMLGDDLRLPDREIQAVGQRLIEIKWEELDRRGRVAAMEESVGMPRGKD